MADAVAGVGGVGVGGVGAPGLIAGLEEGLDLGAADGEEGAEDAAGSLRGIWGRLDEDDGVDGGEAFGPGSAEELHEDGLGLVVEGVGGEDGVGVAGGDEGAEEVVAGLAGGLFEGLAVFGGAGGDVGSVDVEGDVELDAEVLHEGEVGVGFGGFADAVVDVDGGETDSEGFAGGGVGFVEAKEEGDGVGSTGDGGADAVAGVDVVAAEGESGRRRHEA